MKKLVTAILAFTFLISLQIYGQTWSATKRLTWNAGWSELPSIAVDSGNGIHVVWQDFTFGNYEILYKNRPAIGASWSAPKRLTWNANWSEHPSIAADSGNGIHVVWDDITPGNGEIFYKTASKLGDDILFHLMSGAFP